MGAAAYELRDHRGNLVEARNERGQLTYARHSNTELARRLVDGRPARARHRHGFAAYVSGRKWIEPGRMFAGHAAGASSLAIITQFEIEPALDPADRLRAGRHRTCGGDRP
jgi:hypothetical protein